MANNEFCPHCPPLYDGNSWANLGCIVLTILPLILMILFWFFFFLGFFIR
ncbi:MAG: hypothetical protein ACR2MG_16620 [Pyrinomonadaceae bacterium]